MSKKTKDKYGTEHKVLKWIISRVTECDVVKGGKYPVTEINIRGVRIIDDCGAKYFLLNHEFADVEDSVQADCTECEYYAEGSCLFEEECDSETCPLNIPQPIKFDDPVPEFCYWVTDNKIIRCDLKRLYRTLDEAVKVAKKKWG